MREYEEYAAVCVSRAEFGTSGHRTRPAGLVIENYVHRRPVRPDDHVPVKSIVDPRRAVLSLGPHTFVHARATPWTRTGAGWSSSTARGLKPVSWSEFRIHHYWSKSEEELEPKQQQWQEPRRRTARAQPGSDPPESWTRR